MADTVNTSTGKEKRIDEHLELATVKKQREKIIECTMKGWLNVCDTMPTNDLSLLNDSWEQRRKGTNPPSK
jgi:hypothetical protein